MAQDNKFSHTDKPQQADPLEASQGKNDVGTKSAEARIWAAANKLIRNASEPFEEEQ